MSATTILTIPALGPCPLLIKVWDDYEVVIKGRDQQLETAVKELLKEIK
jgi:hypothetical protein